MWTHDEKKEATGLFLQGYYWMWLMIKAYVCELNIYLNKN